MVLHPLTAAREVLRFYRELAPTLPEAATCQVALRTLPDGTPVIALLTAWFGPPAAGEAAVAPIRRFGAPLADLVGPLPYRALQRLLDAAQPPGRRQYWKSAFLPRLDEAVIEAVVDSFARVPSPHALIFIEQHGGAAGRVAPDATALPHRAAPYNFLILGGWVDPAQDGANRAWVRALWAAVQPSVAEGVYVNYLGAPGEEGGERVRAAYGPNYARLAALKTRYDPTNRFRLNQNIPPA